MTTTQISQAERIAQLNEQIHSVHVLYNNAMNMRKRDGSVSRLGAEWDALLAEKRRVERLVPDQSVEVKTRVSYEDTANPRRYGTVTAGLNPGGRNYEITWDDGTIDYSDLRQSGWRFES
jgi:hypothetical protein